MGKWFYGSYDINNNDRQHPWNITFKNIHFISNVDGEYSPFYFGNTLNGTTITFENVTADVTTNSFIDTRAGLDDVHFKGTNTINDAIWVKNFYLDDNLNVSRNNTVNNNYYNGIFIDGGLHWQECQA